MPIKMKVTISKEGNIKVGDIKGAMGPHCEKLTASLQSLGKIISDEKTDDYYKDAGPKVNIESNIVEG